jgi:tetratricopeptide (TPR) repeat protein
LTPALDARAFKLALAELKLRLLTSESSHHQFTRYGNAWGDKAAELERAALQVYEERPQSLSRVISVTHYLHHDLHALAKAIEILFLAERDKVLDSAGRERLVNYLQLAERYAESIPLLEGVIERDPYAIAYRAQLLVAYHRAKRPQQMQESLAAIEKHFHAAGRWNEQNIVTLADACNECELIEQAAGYWDEAISLHQRARPRGAGRDEELSGLYKKVARARSELGQTKPAIDAALAAVVSSGAGFEQQTDARSVLDEVLSQAKDLEDYLAQWDEETAKSGQDSPLLRRAIGQCFQERGDYARAITQLRHAARLQPEDKQIRESLIDCYAASEQPEAEIKELIALANIDRHDATIYERLMGRMANRSTDLVLAGQASRWDAEAERAATSIVEAAPSEAETHASLAKIRENQARWDEAIVQWEPSGLLGLAGAQIRGKHFDAARETLKKLRAAKWPERFNTVDNERMNLERQLPK